MHGIPLVRDLVFTKCVEEFHVVGDEMSTANPGRNICGRVVFLVRCAVYVLVAASIVINIVQVMTVNVQGIPAKSIEQAHERYLREEGPSRRGRLFEQLVLAISPRVEREEDFRSPHDAAPDIIKLLGPPDLVQRRHGTESLIYYYDRDDSKNSAVILSDVGSKNITIGFTNREWVDLHDWAPYKSTVDPPVKKTESGAK
jgi:hypothetical protein